MRVKTVTYGMLRKTEQFENDRAEVTIELNEDESAPSFVRQAMLLAKKTCFAALGEGREIVETRVSKLTFDSLMSAADELGDADGREQEILAEILETEAGRKMFDELRRAFTRSESK